MRRPGLVMVTVLACAVVAPAVWADSKHTKKTDTPWGKGVSEEAQQHALALFQEGNVFYEQARYTEAVPFYEKALKSWDHPSIRFNMAVCLMNMRQPLEAYEHLTQALRYGDAPIGRAIFTQAKTFQAVIENSLAQVAITVIQPDVKVMLDGKEVAVGQGTKTMRVMAGVHQMVATKAGFETESRPLDLPAGKTTPQEITLKPIKERVKVETIRENYERRWPWWVPWAVAGGGVAVGLIGTGVYVDARTKINRYDNELANECPAGCTDDQISPSLSKEARTARRYSQAGIGLWAGAGGLVIAGAVLAVFNRPQKLEEHRVVPALSVSKDHVGIGLTFVLE